MNLMKGRLYLKLKLIEKYNSKLKAEAKPAILLAYANQMVLLPM